MHMYMYVIRNRHYMYMHSLLHYLLAQDEAWKDGLFIVLYITQYSVSYMYIHMSYMYCRFGPLSNTHVLLLPL